MGEIWFACKAFSTMPSKHFPAVRSHTGSGKTGAKLPIAGRLDEFLKEKLDGQKPLFPISGRPI
jgi:hypothetical protein